MKRLSEKSVATEFLDRLKAGNLARGPGLLHFPARAPGKLEMLPIVASLTIITKEKDNFGKNIASSAFFFLFLLLLGSLGTYVFSCPMSSHSPTNFLAA